MKKVLRNLLVCSALALTLTSCSKVTSSYADKIKAAAATEKTTDDYSYEKVVKDLGENWVANACLDGEQLGGLITVKATGIVKWAEGCKSYDDYQAKIDAGKKIKTITVTFYAGYATDATYSVEDWSTSSSAK